MSTPTEDEQLVPAPGATARGRRRLWLAVGVVVVLAGGAVVAALTTSGSGGSVLSGTTGAPAPAFSLTALGQPGQTVALSALEGKDLVVNFWASWCFPCQQEMPVLQHAASHLRGRVRFVGIDSNDTRAPALAFLEKVHVSYETLFDPGAVVAASYGLYGLPTTVFISPSGKILGRHSGQLDSRTLAAALVQAFGSRANPST